MRAQLVGLCLLLAVGAAIACAPADCLGEDVDDECTPYCSYQLGAEGVLDDVAKRASFVRLGKRASFVRLGKRASFVRLGKKKRASFVRLGKKKRASFVRLGKRASFVRLGKRASFVRLGKRASFVRLGKRPSYYPYEDGYLDDGISQHEDDKKDAEKRASFVRLG